MSISQGQHYCQDHQTRYFRNERTDMYGKMNVWYSHKMLDGKGFCVEKLNDQAIAPSKAVFPVRTENPATKSMLMCNAMNNTIALASSGKIELNQIGAYYKRILSELTQTS